MQTHEKTQLQLSVDKVPSQSDGCATDSFAIILPIKKGVITVNMADRIQNLRKTKGISQEELAEKVGVSRQAVSKWESEQSTPDVEKIIIMSEIFEVTTDYILKGTEPVNANNKKTISTLYLGFAVVFAVAAGMWAFTANRFQISESLLITIAGAAIGCGAGLIVQAISGLFRKSA